MKSYTYSGGTWQTINDPLPLIKSANIGSEEGFLSLGFCPYKSRLACRAGRVTIYARNHEVISAKRQDKEIPYDFLCIFYLEGSYVRVWIADFPMLTLFLSEVDAHPEPVDSSIERLIDDVDFQRVVSLMPIILDELFNGRLTITVKSTKV